MMILGAEDELTEETDMSLNLISPKNRIRNFYSIIYSKYLIKKILPSHEPDLKTLATIHFK